jgi:hypothetical protein
MIENRRGQSPCLKRDWNPRCQRQSNKAYAPEREATETGDQLVMNRYFPVKKCDVILLHDLVPWDVFIGITIITVIIFIFIIIIINSSM